MRTDELREKVFQELRSKINNDIDVDKNFYFFEVFSSLTALVRMEKKAKDLIFNDRGKHFIEIGHASDLEEGCVHQATFNTLKKTELFSQKEVIKKDFALAVGFDISEGVDTYLLLKERRWLEDYLAVNSKSNSRNILAYINIHQMDSGLKDCIVTMVGTVFQSAKTPPDSAKRKNLSPAKKQTDDY